MGECYKIHSVQMKDEYEKASLKRDYRYEEEVLEFLKRFLSENERKIELSKKRIENQEDTPELEQLVRTDHTHIILTTPTNITHQH